MHLSFSRGKAPHRGNVHSTVASQQHITFRSITLNKLTLSLCNNDSATYTLNITLSDYVRSQWSLQDC